MARLRFMTVALLALALTGNSTQTGRTQSQVPMVEAPDPLTTPVAIPRPAKPAADDGSCVIYSLADRGFDAGLGMWIAETLPEMIEPSSWQQRGGSGTLRYYAPKNILIVKQSKPIQGKVDGFLKDLKASMPKASAANSTGKKASHNNVVSADYREPAALRPSTPGSDAPSYPVPAAVKPPKHLFHFIIRYEGDGIIDDNVVKFMKTQAQGGKPALTLPTPVPPAYAPAPIVNEAPVSPPTPGYSAPPAVASTPVPATSLPEQTNNAPKEKKNKKEQQKKTPESEY